MSDELWEKFKKDIDKCSSEVSMYAILAKFITRMCIEICQPSKPSPRFIYAIN